jgi:cobaltochelatase CobN
MNVVRYCLGLLLWLAAVCQAQSVLIVATSPVPQGKLTLLREIGQQQGLQVQAELVEKLSPQALPGLFAGRDLVIFDAGREHMQAVVRGRLAPALPGLKAPHIWMRDDAPQAQGLPPALAQRLHAYFVNGGRANFENFFRTLNAHFAGRSADGPPGPGASRPPARWRCPSTAR